MATQTREEYYNSVVAWNEANPNAKVALPEVIRAGDIAFIDGMGNKVLVRDADVTATDVRDIDANGQPTSGWRKANA